MAFVCKVLICDNYKRCQGLADCNSIVVTLIPLFQHNDCSACFTVSCFVSCLSYVSLKYFNTVDISVSLMVWFESLFSTFLIMVTAHHISNKAWPNTIVNVVSSDHKVYHEGFCFGHHCMCKVWWLFNETTLYIYIYIYILFYYRRYNNHKYSCRVENFMLCRNWASHTIPAYSILLL